MTREVRFWAVRTRQGSGYVIAVYPSEVSLHRRFIGPGRQQELVGEYASELDAEKALRAALEEKQRA